MSVWERVGSVFGERDWAAGVSLESLRQRPRLHHFLPYESYEETTQLFWNRGSTGFVLLGHPLVGASLKDQGQLAEVLKQEQIFPEGACLQVLLMASPRIGPFLETWKTARQGEIFQTLAAQRVNFLAGKAFHDPEGHVMRDFRLLISYTVPGVRCAPEDQAALQETRVHLQMALKIMGLATCPLDPEGLMGELDPFLNFSEAPTGVPPVWNPWDSLSRQLLRGDQSWTVEADRVLVGKGDWQFQSYTPHRSPRYWSLGAMDHFLGDLLEPAQVIPCPYVIHYGLCVASRQSVRKIGLNGRREALERSLRNRLTKWMPGLQERYQEADAAVTETQEGGRFVLTSFSLTTFCRSGEQGRMEQHLRRIWQSWGWDFAPARYDHLTVLLSSLPMTGIEQDRSFWGKSRLTGLLPVLETLGKGKVTLTREAQNLLPLLGEWKGQSTPGMLLVGRRGQPFFWSPFGKALARQGDTATNHNYNLCLAGTMGSGKSVFMDDLMTSVLGVGGRVIVLDKGRSFKNACSRLGGQHLEFTVNTALSLNPFTRIPVGESGLDQENRADMLQALVPILEVMASPHHGTTDLQYNHLVKAVHGVWKAKGPRADLDDVVDFLGKAEEQEGREMAHLLYQYSGEGAYGRFFKGPATVSLDHRLVVIETDDLRNHPRLLAVVVQLMILQVNQFITTTRREEPFLILVDEAWEMLSGKKTGDFINAITRTARKYKGSLVLATQSPHDYFKPECPGARVAWELSHWKGILAQDEAAIQAMKTLPELSPLVDTPFKENLLRSLRAHPPHYSEIALFGQGISGVVGRLRLDPYSQLLYSSHPDEYRLLQDRLDQGKTLDHAIQEVLRLQHRRAA